MGGKNETNPSNPPGLCQVSEVTMANGDRIKYDYISGNTTNVTEDEALVEAFLAANANDPDKVMVLRTADQGGKNLRKRRTRNTVNVDGEGKSKIRVSVFQGARRYQDRGLTTDADIKAQRRAEEQEKRMAERRARRAARLAAEQSESAGN